MLQTMKTEGEYEIETDGHDDITHFAFARKEQIELFKRLPEVVCIDGTYGTNRENQDLGFNLSSSFGLKTKQFNRSVSSGETTAAARASDKNCSDDGPTAFFHPRPFGGLQGNDISPSPFSSTATTISPESPTRHQPIMFPTEEIVLLENPVEIDNSVFPASSASNNNNHHHNSTTPCDHRTTSPMNPNSDIVSNRPQTLLIDGTSSPATATAAHNPDCSHGRLQLTNLLTNPLSRQTVTLLASLVDSRLAQHWRLPLLEQLSSPVGTSKDSFSSPTTNPNVLSPDHIPASKRIKFNDASQHTRSSSPGDKSFNSSTSSINPQTTVYLHSCATRLADQFETRYRAKLGDLLNDVSSSSPTATTPADSDEQHSPSVVEEARQHYQSTLTELFRDKINWGRIVAMLAFLRALTEVVSQGQQQLTSPVNSNDQRRDNDGDKLGDHAVANANNIDEEHPTAANSQSDASLSSELPSNNPPNATDYVVWTADFIHAHPVTSAGDDGSDGDAVASTTLWDWINSHGGGWDGLIAFEAERRHHHVDGIGLSDDELFSLMRRGLAGAATVVVGAVGLLAALRFFRSFK